MIFQGYFLPETNCMKKCLFLLLSITIAITVFSQYSRDSAVNKWSVHFQITVIAQRHSGFKAAYSGSNSLADTVEPTVTSLTGTLFLGRKLWKGAAFYLNPEISGGKGLSFTKGVAGALNGETYRVGATEPQVFIARAYLQQHFPLRNTGYENVTDDFNQVIEKLPTSRITISAGKFALSDFYDDNTYSKDPRTQFFNWSLWANGAWDYPANTRGYTYGLVAELFRPGWSLRLSSVAVPRIANAPEMEYDITRAHGETIEFKHSLFIHKHPGSVGVIVSNSYTKAPTYKAGLKALADDDVFLLDVIQGNVEGKTYGGKKIGIGLNVEQELSDNVGIFSRAGWNGGKYVSWAFTEIDRTVNVGISIKGTRWKRPGDVLAVATVFNGLSAGHKEYLAAGGYGFIIGDGQINYGYENIIEAYYIYKMLKLFWLTVDYQLVNHPGYNKDRGPVNVFALRFHYEL